MQKNNNQNCGFYPETSKVLSINPALYYIEISQEYLLQSFGLCTFRQEEGIRSGKALHFTPLVAMNPIITHYFPYQKSPFYTAFTVVSNSIAKFLLDSLVAWAYTFSVVPSDSIILHVIERNKLLRKYGKSECTSHNGCVNI